MELAKYKELLSALDAFRCAARELTDLWGEAEGDVLIKDYPLKESFDEFVGAVELWYKSNKPFAPGMFYANVLNIEHVSCTLRDIENVIADAGGVDSIGSPNVYTKKDAHFVEEEIEFSHALLYPNDCYILII